ncbi:MAG TPA: C45 family peptidase [Candidatus Acidoferrum sp.]|nr:C45 family peptidase [Candidatus Acidoferrum sp.]
MRNDRNRLAMVLVMALGVALAATQVFATSLRAADGQQAQAAAPATQSAAATQSAPAAQSSAATPSDSHYQSYPDDPRLAKAYRFDRGGWTYVHLEGTPYDLGYQHGYLLANEIADAFAAVSLEMTHASGRDWDFFRRAAHEMIWHRIDPEYQAELQGIVGGLEAQKVKLDIDDIVAMNGFMELADYYVPWLNSVTKAANPPNLKAPEACSAFVATGSWTKGGQIVMAHNNWTSYADGERWKIVFDIMPDKGYRMLMDGFPGVIVSDDDFTINSAGLMVTETTITDFHGWDPTGKAEFVRARKAMQYAGSIDDFVKIMLDGNNGGYANDWLLGDRKTGEIARFENGLKHTKVWRTKDGYFVGSNFASDPDVLKDETTFDSANMAASANARHVRWDQLMAENKGKIDTTMAEAFESDHYDSYAKKETTGNRRTLCGHGDAETPGDPTNEKEPFRPSGAVQAKVTDSKMAEAMSFIARIGHPCGTNFNATKFLEEHTDYSWQAPVLRDMNAGPWTQFKAGDHAAQAAQ